MIKLNLKQRLKHPKETLRQINHIISIWINSVASVWVHKTTLLHLNTIRLYELDLVIKLIPIESKILDIGAGIGWQAKYLADKGYDVIAIDIPSSGYRNKRVWPIIDYDGKQIPFRNNTFDVILSSNVLEHIPHLYGIQEELYRVSKPQGRAIHIVPSASWRFWTIITNLLKLSIIPKVHGEHSNNPVTEICSFCSKRWTRILNSMKWNVVAHYTNHLFYTGHSIMDSRLNMKSRHLLSRIIGSSCHIFVLQRNNIHKQGSEQKKDLGCNDVHKVTLKD